MTMTKRFWHWNFLVLAVVLVTHGLHADDRNPKKAEPSSPKSGEVKSDKTGSSWMKLKLEYSQKILAGIAKGDFDEIVQSAEAMQSLTSIEGFVRGRMPGYATQLEMFKDANSELIKQAKKDNVEGTALAFTQMTLSCVNCHKRLREEGLAAKR